ncbi:MAG: substrate-binding domain-containing protein [Candidatus Hydrogenedentes bacterium]|nr:substrate-binding domain-containing protein [Candidatus Hydrogenedentota bacterium]
MGRTSIVAAVAIGVLAVAGCSGGGDGAPVDRQPTPAQPEAAPVKGTIGLSVLTLTNPFFKEIADTVTAEAEKYGFTVHVESGDFDVVQQQHQVKNFIVEKVSVIVLTPCDSKAIGPAIQEANQAGIPVFTADIACLAPGAKVVSHIATDNYQGGRLAAKALLEAIGGKGKVAILDHPMVESVMLRTKGFHDELAEAASRPDVDIEVVATLPGGGAKDVSFKAAQDLLQAHPELDAIFAINDPSALGAVAALEEAGKLDRVKVIGFDGQPEGKAAIKAGSIYADPVQFPDQIGRKTVEAIMNYLEGEEVPAEILIPTSLYRQADAQQDPAVAGP